MTVKEKLISELCNKGMFRQQAQKVLEISIPEIDFISDDYQILWDEHYSIYNEDMYSFLFSIIKQDALKWIEEFVPNAWFKENFID